MKIPTFEELIYSRGNLLTYPLEIATAGLPVLIQRMLLTIKEKQYWSFGLELNRSTEEEIEAFKSAMCNTTDSNIYLRIACVCSLGEGYGDITTYDAIGDINSNILYVFFLREELKNVGYKLDYKNISLFDTNKKIFKNISIEGMRKVSIPEVVEMINKEII